MFQLEQVTIPEPTDTLGLTSDYCGPYAMRIEPLWKEVWSEESEQWNDVPIFNPLGQQEVYL